MQRHMLPLGLAAMLYSPFFHVTTVQAQPAVVDPYTTTHTATVSGSEASARTLSLAQALALAETRSSSLSAARRDVLASDGALQQAGLRRNPELGALVEDTRQASRTTTATVAFPIELGGKRAARVAAADRTRDVAVAELGHARSQLRAAVVAAFFGVLVAQERVQLAVDSAALAARGADATARRVAAGKVSPVDETRSRVDLANAQLEVVEAQAELQSARQALVAHWGDAEPAFDQVSGEVEQPPARPALAELTAAVDDAPSLVVSRREIDRRRALLDVERSKRHADLTFSVGAKRDNEVGRTQAVVGLTIPLQLFDRNQGNVEEASQRADQAGDAYQAARIQLVSELRQASMQLTAARTTTGTLKDTVLPAAQQAFEAATRGFEAGKFGFLDVIDAQRALLQARARYLGALATSHQAATAIDRLLGRAPLAAP